MSMIDAPAKLTPHEGGTEAKVPSSLAVGNRVRVRQGVGTRIDCPNLPHFLSEAGHAGTVVAVRAPAGVTDHPFLVIFAQPVPLVHMIGKQFPLPTRHYAAEELERLIS